MWLVFPFKTFKGHLIPNQILEVSLLTIVLVTNLEFESDLA